MATATGNTSINLSWTAATDNVGVTGYRVERCQGAGCTTFAQIATPAGTTFGDTGLTAGTSYSYRVRATDAATNLGPYSNTASATTTSVDQTPPTAPSNLVATATGNTSINLSWTAATDNVGVTGYRVERCQGAGCTTFAQIATPAGTTLWRYRADGGHQLQLSRTGDRRGDQPRSVLEHGERHHDVGGPDAAHGAIEPRGHGHGEHQHQPELDRGDR